MMNEPKVAEIHIRISCKDKEIIKKYITINNLGLSDFIRDTCLNKIKESEEKGEQNDV